MISEILIIIAGAGFAGLLFIAALQLGIDEGEIRGRTQVASGEYICAQNPVTEEWGCKEVE